MPTAAVLTRAELFHKVRDIIRAHGVSGLARRTIAFAYRQAVRPYIPFREVVYYAGIPTCRDRKWSDRMVPTSWVAPLSVLDEPDYEAALVAGLTETIRPGDRVV